MFILYKNNKIMELKRKIIYCGKKNINLVLDYIDDDLMIYNENNGNVHVLNNTAKFIWDSIFEKTSVCEIIKKLKSTFEVDNLNELENDVQDILNNLEEQELIICYREDCI